MAPRFMVPPTAQYRSVAMTPATGAADAQVKTAIAPSETPVSQVVERVFIMREPQPEVNVNDELDAFYARMAKIRLEKHQLDDALALIQKIKSDTFRVRTIVSLAEYVSRDKNFEREADHLFRLALESMEALDRGQPARAGVGNGQNVQRPLDPLLPVIAPPSNPGTGTIVPEPPADPPVDVQSSTGAGSVSVLPTPAQPVPPVDEPPPAPVPRPEPVPLDDPPGPPPGPPEVSPTPGEGRPSIWVPLPDEARQNNNGNGRQPPPPAPQSNGVDGIVTTPPGNQSPTETPVMPPPADTTNGNGLTPPPPLGDPTPPQLIQDPPPSIQAPPDFVRPSATIPLDDSNGALPVVPVVVPEDREAEGQQPTQQPTQTPRRAPVFLDEN